MEYRTSDYQLAATLLSLDFKMEGLDKSDPTRMQFIFEDSPELEEVVGKYWGKTLKVEPNALWNNFKIIKNLLYEAKRMP